MNKDQKLWREMRRERDMWLELGQELFEDYLDFDEWLNTPNFFFDGNIPRNSEEHFIRERLTAMQYGDNI